MPHLTKNNEHAPRIDHLICMTLKQVQSLLRLSIGPCNNGMNETPTQGPLSCQVTATTDAVFHEQPNDRSNEVQVDLSDQHMECHLISNNSKLCWNLSNTGKSSIDN